MADNTVIIYGKNPQINRRTASTVIADKIHHENSIPKVLDSDDPPPPKKISHLMSQNILQARTTKGVTRKQAGQHLSMSEALVTSFETIGTVINNTNSKKFTKYYQYLGLVSIW